MIKRVVLYYFTGTGNALAATNWIAQVAKENNIQSEIHKITPSLSVENTDDGENTLVGFCYPTHGFNAPPVVLRFLLRFPKGKNRVFLLNTRAGMKLSKLFMPGLSGLAQLFPALLLWLKGYKMVGLQPMDLPSNWISIHPGLRQKVVDSIFVRCERITKKFAEKILSGGKRFKGLLSLPVDLLISPISLAYYFLGRFALAKTFVAGSNCNGCSLCEKECPVHAIEMKNSRPFWTARCESCMHCMNCCPRRAIQTPHLFVVVLWWLVFLFIPMVILKNVLKFHPENETLYNLVFDVVTIITAFPIIFFSYRILHFLMKYRFFNWLVTFTSLTKLKFWRRYFAPKKYLS